MTNREKDFLITKLLMAERIIEAAEYLLDHVPRDYSEWKEPLEKDIKTYNEKTRS